MRAHFGFMAVAVFTLAACDRSPVEPAHLTGSFSAVSSCNAVAFHVAAVPTSPGTFTGPITGDLEGTASFQFGGDPKVTGKTLAATGIASWTITGGVVPVPLTFTTEFDNRNLNSDHPGSPATVIETLGKHRALSGVNSANLEFRGVVTVAPAVVVNLDFRGVICL